MILLDEKEIIKAIKAVYYGIDPDIDVDFESIHLTNRAQAKKIAEWGSGVCSHGTSIDGAGFVMQPRRQCDECWLELLKEIG